MISDDRSHPTTDAYRENFDRIFRKRRPRKAAPETRAQMDVLEHADPAVAVHDPAEDR